MLVVLTRDIYVQSHFFPKGLFVLLDRAEGVAFADGVHFDIELEDYQTLH